MIKIMFRKNKTDKARFEELSEKRRLVPKFLRNTMISVVVLLLLLVGAGVVYTYFSQSPTNLASITKPAADSSYAPIKPAKPATNAQEGASVEVVTSPVKAGSNASVTVQTDAGSTCKISVVYNEVPAKDSGLAQKTADAYGAVSWAWTVGELTPVGTWPINVTCTYNQKSAVVQANLQVT